MPTVNGVPPQASTAPDHFRRPLTPIRNPSRGFWCTKSQIGARQQSAVQGGLLGHVRADRAGHLCGCSNKPWPVSASRCPAQTVQQCGLTGTAFSPTNPHHLAGIKIKAGHPRTRFARHKGLVRPLTLQTRGSCRHPPCPVAQAVPEPRIPPPLAIIGVGTDKTSPARIIHDTSSR